MHEKRSTKKKPKTAGSGSKQGSLYLRGDVAEQVVRLVIRLLDDPRVPDGRLSSKQAFWWFRARGGVYGRVHYSSFQCFLTSTSHRRLKQKWASKCSGRGSKGDDIIRENGDFVNDSQSGVLSELPGYAVIQILRKHNAELLLAPPSDLVARLLGQLSPSRRLELRVADRLAYAGVKLPAHQNECYKAATRGGKAHCRSRFAGHVIKLRDSRRMSILHDNLACAKALLSPAASTARVVPAAC